MVNSAVLDDRAMAAEAEAAAKSFQDVLTTNASNGFEEILVSNIQQRVTFTDPHLWQHYRSCRKRYVFPIRIAKFLCRGSHSIVVLHGLANAPCDDVLATEGA